jgi:diguanylate cyclase (GGDEF)-like protein/PAS domain S-box-containing protein
LRDVDRRLGAIADGADAAPITRAEALLRMAEAEDTLRAIGAGEVDAFVVSDGGTNQSVFSLTTADRPYRMFVENMRDGAATLSSSGLILYANRRLAELLSLSRESLVGSPLATFVAGGAPTLEQIRRPGWIGATIEFDLVNAAGATVPVLVGASPLDVDGEHLSCLTFTDLTARKAQDREIAQLSQAQAERMTELQDVQAALTEQATHDALTGLPTRALVVDRIDQALSRSRRSGLCTAVLFVDLDHFKQVNDTHGHAAGDTVLRRVAEKLVDALRPMDTVARLGGDEFVVLAPDIADHADAADVGARLIAALSGPVEPDSIASVGASVGIAVSVAGNGTAETLLSEADTAMYHAKSLGGGHAQLYDGALGRRIHQRSIARGVLQAALDDRRIVMHYQPMIDLSTGNVAGCEALARIAERDGSILPPSAFISVAEDSGLVVPLGTQVLAMACRSASLWQRADRAVTVAVNVSFRQFERGDLTTVVREALAESDLDPRCLHLELTETALIDLRPDLLQQLRRIRNLGVQIGLDDFGTGYASLTHLRRLPLTFVKIDQSFVQGLGVDAEDERIVSAVVDLAANLGLRSIVEGIETKAQLDRLLELGCDQGQGYYFARPLSPGDVPAMLDHPVW